MEIKFLKKPFLSALNIGGSMAGHSKVLQILECVLIEPCGDSFKISSYDQETYVSQNVEYEHIIGEQIPFCVSYRDLKNAVSSISGDYLIIETDGQFLTLKHQNGEMEFTCGDAQFFPVPVRDLNAVSVNLPSERLFKCINEAKGFVSTDEIRLVMTGVYISVENKMVSIAATNGTKAYINEFETDSEENVCAIIPSKSINSLLQVLNETDEATVTIGHTNIMVSVYGSEFVARSVEGRYPNVKAIMPNTHTSEAECNRMDLLASVKRALIASDSANKISLTFSGVNVEVKAADFNLCKKASDNCLCSFAGNDIKIGLNGSYLIDVIGSIVGETIVIRMTENSRPILLCEKNEHRKKIVVMPIRLD